jgi:hypothetical protein
MLADSIPAGRSPLRPRHVSLPALTTISIAGRFVSMAARRLPTVETPSLPFAPMPTGHSTEVSDPTFDFHSGKPTERNNAATAFASLVVLISGDAL